MNYIFKKVNLDKDLNKWNKLVEKTDKNHYVSFNPSLSSFFSKYYGLKSTYYFAYQDNKIVALIPGVKLKGKFISLPIFSLSGFFILEEINVEKLYLDFISFLELKFEIRTAENFSKYIYKDKVLCFFDLKDTVEDQLSFYKSKHRSQILKGYKNGLEAKIGGKELLPDFYKIYKKSLHILGTPVPGLDYFNTLFDTYKFGEIKVFLVKKDNIVIGAGIYMTYLNFSEIVWAATLREYNKLNTNLVLYWEMVKYSILNNKKTFSMGRSTVGSSGEKYKDNWMCDKIVINYNYSDQYLVKKENETLKESWKKLPFAIANIVGPIIRKKVMS